MENAELWTMLCNEPKADYITLIISSLYSQFSISYKNVFKIQSAAYEGKI